VALAGMNDPRRCYFFVRCAAGDTDFWSPKPKGTLARGTIEAPKTKIEKK